MKYFLSLILSIAMILNHTGMIHAETGKKTWTMQSLDNGTITESRHSDKIQLLVFADMSRDSSGKFKDQASADLICSLGFSGWTASTGELITLYVCTGENGESGAANVNNLLNGSVSYADIVYGGDADALVKELTGGRKPVYPLCAIYRDGQFVEQWEGAKSDADCAPHVSKFMKSGEFSIFDIVTDTKYNQTEARRMLDMVNELRTGNNAWYWNDDNTEKIYVKNLPKLKWDYGLEKAAMQRAAEVALWFDHSRPDGSWTNRLAWETGYPNTLSGENIALTMDSDAYYAQSLLEEGSRPAGEQEHRLTMLGDWHGSFAAASVEAPEGTYWVQLFSYQYDDEPKTAAFDGIRTSVIRAKSTIVNDWQASAEDFTVVEKATGKMSDHTNLKLFYMTSRSWKMDIQTKTPLTWTSDHPEIVSVNGDTYRAVGGGTAVLTAKLPGTKKTLKCSVMVLDEEEPSASYTAMYRLYNPNSGEHFYTGNVKERNALVTYGWKYEGIGWKAPKTSSSPVYRLYNKAGGEHHYTLNKKERDALVKLGWKSEDIGWYSDDSKTVPVYREYNPNAFANNHNYTPNIKEHNALISKYGWKDEGIAWYGLNE